MALVRFPPLRWSSGASGLVVRQRQGGIFCCAAHLAHLSAAQGVDGGPAGLAPSPTTSPAPRSPRFHGVVGATGGAGQQRRRAGVARSVTVPRLRLVVQEGAPMDAWYDWDEVPGLRPGKRQGNYMIRYDVDRDHRNVADVWLGVDEIQTIQRTGRWQGQPVVRICGPLLER